MTDGSHRLYAAVDEAWCPRGLGLLGGERRSAVSALEASLRQPTTCSTRFRCARALDEYILTILPTVPHRPVAVPTLQTWRSRNASTWAA